MKLFSDDEFHLLKDILWRWNPKLLTILAQPTLTADEREEIRGTLAEELVSRGLHRDSEPNEYGLQIEDLIDKIGEIPESNDEHTK